MLKIIFLSKVMPFLSSMCLIYWEIFEEVCKLQERVKTVKETVEMLGVSRSTIYNLLRRGELKRAPSIMKDSRGRPLTRIIASSIVTYIKNH